LPYSSDGRFGGIIVICMITLQQLLADSQNFSQLAAELPPNFRRQAAQIVIEFPEEVAELCAALLSVVESQTAASGATNSSSSHVLASFDELSAILLRQAFRFFQTEESAALSDDTVEILGQLYRKLGGESRARHHLLRILATAGDRDGLESFAELAATDPPQNPEDAVLAFVPLFQRKDYPAQALFPRLLDALEHPTEAATVLDLANYLTRRRRLSPHPAAARDAALTALLGNLTTHLEKIETGKSASAAKLSALDLRRHVAESVTLVVSLCDTLALIGSISAISTLQRTMGLAHRRVKTEAAAALASLGDESGIQTLVDIAAEPVVRNRALAYLEELQLIDRVDAKYCTDVARAEGEMAAWLAEPAQFGLSPQILEIVDTCTQKWPGYHEPVCCRLWRYEYRLRGKTLSGIGITGPMTHAFHADLQDMSPADIYAVFAGWQAEHEEIFEISADELTVEQSHAWSHIVAALEKAGLSELQLVKLGHFFGAEIFVATGLRADQPGAVILDGQEIHWYPLSTSSSRAPGANEIYSLHKGKRLLRAFNAEDAS
jgi:hypothetical protein